MKKSWPMCRFRARALIWLSSVSQKFSLGSGRREILALSPQESAPYGSAAIVSLCAQGDYHSCQCAIGGSPITKTTVTKSPAAISVRASHTKPRRDSTNDERLDGENGLLLTPTIGHLFDKEFISLENKGDLIVSPVADKPSLLKMGIRPEGKLNVGVFSERQRLFLEYHRENVVRMSSRR